MSQPPSVEYIDSKKGLHPKVQTSFTLMIQDSFAITIGVAAYLHNHPGSRSVRLPLQKQSDTATTMDPSSARSRFEEASQ